MNDTARRKQANRVGRPRRSDHPWTPQGWLELADALALDDLREVREARAVVTSFTALSDAKGNSLSLVPEPSPPDGLARSVWTECVRLGLEPPLFIGLVLASREGVCESTPAGGRRCNKRFRRALQALHDSVRSALRRQRCQPGGATRVVSLLCMLLTTGGVPLSELPELRVLVRDAEGRWLTGSQRQRLLTKRVDQLVN
jgi:hypothetical protein